jgi:hypothetical protein
MTLPELLLKIRGEYSGPRFQDNSLRWCLLQKGAGNERKKAQKFHQPVQDESGT